MKAHLLDETRIARERQPPEYWQLAARVIEALEEIEQLAPPQRGMHYPLLYACSPWNRLAELADWCEYVLEHAKKIALGEDPAKIRRALMPLLYVEGWPPASGDDPLRALLNSLNPFNGMKGMGHVDILSRVRAASRRHSNG